MESRRNLTTLERQKVALGERHDTRKFFGHKSELI